MKVENKQVKMSNVFLLFLAMISLVALELVDEFTPLPDNKVLGILVKILIVGGPFFIAMYLGVEKPGWQNIVAVLKGIILKSVTGQAGTGETMYDLKLWFEMATSYFNETFLRREKENSQKEEISKALEEAVEKVEELKAGEGE